MYRRILAVSTAISTLGVSADECVLLPLVSMNTIDDLNFCAWLNSRESNTILDCISGWDGWLVPGQPALDIEIFSLPYEDWSCLFPMFSAYVSRTVEQLFLPPPPAVVDPAVETACMGGRSWSQTSTVSFRSDECIAINADALAAFDTQLAVLTANQPATCVAESQTAQWLSTMDYCAWKGAVPSCIASELLGQPIYDGDNAIKFDSRLALQMYMQTPCAETCLVAYMNAVSAILTGSAELKTACAGGNDWDDIISPDSFTTQRCLQALKDLIDELNTCMGTGLDIVTGRVNRRSSETDVLQYMLAVDPYTVIMDARSNEALLDENGAIAGVVANALTVPGSASNVAQCTMNMAEDLAQLDPGACSLQGDYRTNNCLNSDGLKTILNQFMLCTGGWAMNTLGLGHMCINDDRSIAETIYQPFQQYWECSVAGDGNSFSPNSLPFFNCLGIHNGLTAVLYGLLVSQACVNTCAGALAQVMYDECRSLADTTSMTDCVAVLNLPPSDHLGWGPLGQFAFCSGYQINTASTVFAKESVSLFGQSAFPLIAIALDSHNADVADVASAVNDQYASVGAPSRTCYARTASALFLYFDANIVAKAACAGNPYGLTCLSVISGYPLGLFSECAGWPLETTPYASCGAGAINTLNAANFNTLLYNAIEDNPTPALVVANLQRALNSVNVDNSVSQCAVDCAQPLIAAVLSGGVTHFATQCCSNANACDVNPQIASFAACSGMTYDYFPLSAAGCSATCSHDDVLFGVNMAGMTYSGALHSVLQGDGSFPASAHACSECVADFRNALFIASDRIAPCAVQPFDDSCYSSSDVVGALANFRTCSGGYPMMVSDTFQQCDPLFDTFHAFPAMVDCQVSHSQDTTSCLGSNTFLGDTVSLGISDGCMSCYAALQAQIEAHCSADVNDCATQLSVEDGGLDSFHACAGFALTTTPMTCPAPGDVPLFLQSYIPILLAMRSDIQNAGNAVAIVQAMLSTHLTDSNADCAYCYTNAVPEIFSRVTGGSPCRINLYSSECQDSLAVPLARIAACTGYAITNDSPYQCMVSGEVSQLAAAGVFSQIVDYVGSPSYASPELAESAYLDAVGVIASSLTVPFECSVCAGNVVYEAISQEADLVACETNPACSFAEGLNAFSACAGFDLIDFITTTSSTTPEATSTTASATTAATTATTVVTTTTAPACTPAEIQLVGHANVGDLVQCVYARGVSADGLTNCVNGDSLVVSEQITPLTSQCSEALVAFFTDPSVSSICVASCTDWSSTTCMMCELGVVLRQTAGVIQRTASLGECSSGNLGNFAVMNIAGWTSSAAAGLTVAACMMGQGMAIASECSTCVQTGQSRVLSNDVCGMPCDASLGDPSACGICLVFGEMNVLASCYSQAIEPPTTTAPSGAEETSTTTTSSISTSVAEETTTSNEMESTTTTTTDPSGAAGVSIVVAVVAAFLSMSAL